MSHDKCGQEKDGSEVPGAQAPERRLGRVGPCFAESEPWLASLRALLETSQTTLSAGLTARLLGMSARTMQRHLRRHGTTFQREVRTACRDTHPSVRRSDGGRSPAAFELPARAVVSPPIAHEPWQTALWAERARAPCSERRG